MCLFIYTLPQLCNHLSFQNVSECAVARGLPSASSSASSSSLTLQAPVFLFDTMRSRSRTPEYYSSRFACKKRRAVRPVLTLCARCGGGEGGGRRVVMVGGSLERESVRESVRESEGEGEGGVDAGPERYRGERRVLLSAKESAGSLLGGGSSASSSSSSSSSSGEYPSSEELQWAL